MWENVSIQCKIDIPIFIFVEYRLFLRNIKISLPYKRLPGRFIIEIIAFWFFRFNDFPQNNSFSHLYILKFLLQGICLISPNTVSWNLGPMLNSIGITTRRKIQLTSSKLQIGFDFFLQKITKGPTSFIIWKISTISLDIN